MATFTITTNVNIDTLTSKAGSDTYNINGTTAQLTIDQDSRYGTNQTTSAALGTITPSASLGGTISIDGRAIWLIPFTGGSGTVPAYNTTISLGSASGLLIGVVSALNATPTAVGAGMPATGFIKVKQWNGILYGTGALTGITATAAAGEKYGWLEIVGVDSTTLNLARLNNNTVPVIQGKYFNVGTTSGSNATTYQIPTNGSICLMPGVFVDTATPVNVSTASWSGNVITVTTTGAHGISAGMTVFIDGVLPFGYNGDYLVTGVGSSTTFTVANTVNPGAYTSGGTTSTCEFYGTTSDSALPTKIATDATRGKYCWISTAGLVRFQNDGTNSTGGYLPPSGRVIRVPNVFLYGCTAGALTVNALNSTISSRYKIATANSGPLAVDHAGGMWQVQALSNPYSYSFNNCAFTGGMNMTGPTASAPIIRMVGIGNPVTSSTAVFTYINSPFPADFRDLWLCAGNWGTKFGFTNASGLIGGTFKRIYVTGTGDPTTSAGFSIQSGYSLTLSDSVISPALALTSLGNIPGGTSTIKNITWYTSPFGFGCNTSGTIPLNIASFTQNVLIDGWSAPIVGQGMRVNFCTFGGSSSNITLRNFGTADAPIDFRDSDGNILDAAFSWSGAVVTVTKTAHGLTSADQVYIYQSSDETACPLGQKTPITVTGANTFTFAGGVSGTTGTVCFFKSWVNAVFSPGGNNNNITIQNCHFLGNQAGGLTGQTSNFVQKIQNYTTDTNIQIANLMIATNLTYDSGTQWNQSPTSNSAQYGSSWFNQYVLPYNTTRTSTSKSYTDSAGVITVTNTAHGLIKNDRIFVWGDDPTKTGWGWKAIANVPSSSTFTFNGAGGSTPGTLDYTVPDGRIVITGNEGNATSTTYAIDSGTDVGFSGSGTILLPTVNDQMTWTSPTTILSYDSFPIAPPEMGTATITNYDISYDIDKGAGYSGTFKNLSYPRAGGSGSNASTTVTMTSTTGVNVNDYVFGQGIGKGAKVSSITNSTDIVVSVANKGAVTGILQFSYLPNESSITSAGFNLKVRIKTSTASATGISFLAIPTTSTNTTRKQLYSQATSVPITITVQRSDTLAPVSGALVYVTANSGGPLSVGTVIVNKLTTDVNGQVTTTFLYTSDQPIVGWAREASSSPLFAQAQIGGKIISTGYSSTTFVVPDE